MHDPLNVYRGRYKEYIDSIIKERPSNERFQYSEDHHIVPRCTFEDKDDSSIDDEDNHIHLSYREHFIAHKLLYEENTSHIGLFYAYWRMCNGKIRLATPEEYEEARKVHINFQKSIAIGNKSKLGQVTPDVTRERISQAKTGYKYGPRRYNILCKNCGIQFVANSPSACYCNECSKLSLPTVRKYPPRQYRLVCKTCGSSFVGKFSSQKFCDICREAT